jgi:shikimate 5-dehydrogenase
MPFKRVARDYLLSLDGRAKINSSLYNEVNINTILILAKNNFIGLNTDILGIKDYLDSIDFYKRYSGIHIIGNGAYGDSVKKVCIDKRIAHLRDPNKYQPTDSVKHQHNFLVFNASPVILEGKNIINANTSTETGKQLSFYQAQKQLELYEQNFFSKE